MWKLLGVGKNILFLYIVIIEFLSNLGIDMRLNGGII